MLGRRAARKRPIHRNGSRWSLTREGIVGVGFCVDVVDVDAGLVEHIEKVQFVDGFGVGFADLDDTAFDVIEKDVVEALHPEGAAGLHDGGELVDLAFADQVGGPVRDQEEFHGGDPSACDATKECL